MMKTAVACLLGLVTIQVAVCQNYTLICQICSEVTPGQPVTTLCNSTVLPTRNATNSVNGTAATNSMCRIWVSGNRTLQKEMVFASQCDNTTLNNDIIGPIPKFLAYTGSPDARCCNWTNCNADFATAGLPGPLLAPASAGRIGPELMPAFLAAVWIALKLRRDLN